MRLMTESKLDSRASLISRDVIQHLKNNMDEINATVGKFMSPTVKVMVKDAEFSLPTKKSDSSQPDIATRVVLKIFEQPRDGVQSTAGFGGNTLRITLVIMSTTGNLKPLHLSKIQEESYEAVRHELEHSVQDSQDVSSVVTFNEMMKDKKNLASFKKYHLNRKELPAFVSGIYNQAKKLRRPFLTTLDEFLKKAAMGPLKAGAPPDKVQSVIEEIRSAWIDYARIRFPKAMIE